jgi:pilus assembly protein FimV
MVFYRAVFILRGRIMSLHRRKLLPLYIASLLSGQAAAVSMGDIQLKSSLGTPLQAQVPLAHLGELSADQLKIKIGSEADYQAMGVEFTYQHTQLKIEPIVINGQGYVRITTRDPVAEPYLNFVLNLQWPQGQVSREYTVLLDPPENAAPVAQNGNAVIPVADEMTAPRPAPRSAHAAAPRREPAEGTYYTQRGDSLWRVATQLRPSGVPLAQMMNAVLAANPSAFIDGNPNRLKEAMPIAMPTSQQIAAAGAAGAGAPVTAATNSEHVAAAAVPAPAASSAPAADNAPAAAAALQLASENASLKSEVAELTGNVASLNQNLAASEQRLRQMETQLDDLMKQFQQQRATTQALAMVGASKPVGAPPAPESLISQVNASELTSPPRAHTPWWVHLLYWLGIGGMGAWAIREHFWPRRLAMAGAVNPQQSHQRPMARVPSPPLPAPSSTWVDAAEGGRAWQKADAVILDVEETAPVRREHAPVAADQFTPAMSEPVDASISAGVFVAFGRFSEAENLLKEALHGAPDRADLKLQLLDVYLQADDSVAFDELAAAVERDHGEPDVLAELAVLRDSYHSRH